MHNAAQSGAEADVSFGLVFSSACSSVNLFHTGFISCIISDAA